MAMQDLTRNIGLKGVKQAKEFSGTVLGASHDGVGASHAAPAKVGSDKRPCKHGLAESKDGVNRAIVSPNNDPPPAQKFDKVAYQREYMRKRRAAAKLK